MTRKMKVFSTIDQQIKIQEVRRLIITDKDYFTNVLLDRNYFDVVNGFESIVLKNHSNKEEGYLDDVESDDLINLYELDMKLGMEVLELLRCFEIKLKSRIAYYFSKEHCNTLDSTLNYLDKTFYNCPSVTSYQGTYLKEQFDNNSFVVFAKYNIKGKKVNDGTLNFAETSSNRSDYVKSYEKPPLWVIIKRLTFNDLYIFFGLLGRPVLDHVLAAFSLAPGDREYFLNCLDLFKLLRNHCAHFELISKFTTPREDINLKLIYAKHPELRPKTIKANGDIFNIKLFDSLLVLNSFVKTNKLYEVLKQFQKDYDVKEKSFIVNNMLIQIGIKSAQDLEKLRCENKCVDSA